MVLRKKLPKKSTDEGAEKKPKTDIGTSTIVQAVRRLCILLPVILILPLEENEAVDIVDGATTRLWLDNWVGDRRLKENFRSLFQLERYKSCYVKDRIRWTDTGQQLCWDWNAKLETQIQLQELQQIEATVQQLPEKLTSDSCSWEGTKDGMFSVAAVRKWLYALNTDAPDPGHKSKKIIA